MSNPGKPSDDPPRILVDEDWKAQVQREKESQSEGHGTAENKPDESAEFPLPPPSLSGIVSMFASQTMAALGLLPDPMTGEAEANRSLAKFLIDTLAVLEQKTEGNRTAEESNELRDALHHLRMIYIAAPPRSDSASHESSTRASRIELP